MKRTFTLLFSLIFSSTLLAQSLDGSMGSTSTVDGTFTKAGGLTDQQANEAKTFVHEGKKQQDYEKACKDNGSVCDGRGTQGGIEDQIGKLYILVFGGLGVISGGGPSVKVTAKPEAKTAETAPAPDTGAAQGAAGKTAKKETENKADYCLYGAMVGEGLATVIQSSQQQQVSQEAANLNDPQLSALVQLKETHKARKKTATLQSAIYGATAACYAARKLLQPSVVMDTKYIIKMGAAAGISALYMKKASKHADNMKKIQKVIDSLPKAGDCNPWTGTSCFCKEATSQTLYPGQYQEVCQLNNGIADGPKSNLGCGVLSGGVVTLDKECTCKQNNTCLQPILKFANPSIGFGTNFLAATNAGYALMDTSQFDEGKLKAYSVAAGALNNRMKQDLPVPDVNLSPEQKKIADELKEVVPPAVADMAASQSASSSGADAAMGSGLNTGLKSLSAPLQKQLSSPEISGGYRSQGGAVADAGAVSEAPFTFPGMNGESGPAGGVEVLHFSDKAMTNAEVSNRPETPIFDIISNRYRSSGWNRLGNDLK